MKNSDKNPEPVQDMTPTLILKLRGAHTHAGAMLDDLYRRKLISFALGYVYDQALAEDIVQDVFYRVLKSETVPDNFRAWVYRICRNRCLDARRSGSRRRDDQEMPAASRIDADLTGPLTHLVREQQRAQLHRVVSTLPEPQREALLLRYGEGLSRAEIADVLDVSENLVKSRIFHGLEKLRGHASLVDDK